MKWYEERQRCSMKWYEERQKWTSKNVVKAIKELNKKRDKLLKPVRDELDSVESSIDTMQGILKVAIIDEKGTPKDPIHYNYITFGDWDCEDSPTKKCIYGFVYDHANDRCIYCGEPDERK